MKDLILVGIQGSGKGTQAKILAADHGYTIFETGAALRAMAASGSELGEKVKAIMNRGDLVSNEVVMEIVADFIENNATDGPIIFDGIPRSEEQRVCLEALLAEKGRSFQVLAIELSEEVAFERMFARAKIEGRADDNETAMKKRVANFYKFTAPLLNTWKASGKLVPVSGEHTIEEVTDRISRALELS